MLHWYLVHSKPSGEVLAQENLLRQGYEVYLPRLAQRVRRAGRWERRILALFPRYLFLGLREKQSLSPVRSSVGVSSVVRFGTSFAAVPDAIIRDLKSREDPFGLHHVAPRNLVSGAAVTVTAGPFDGLQGIFEREAGDDRVVVLLNVLGQSASLQIPTEFVSPQFAA
jgi:transcriptional antiterminator RfaH